MVFFLQRVPQVFTRRSKGSTDHKFCPVLWQRIPCLLLVLRSVYLTLSDSVNTVSFSYVTNSVATAVLPIFPHHTLPRTASHVFTRFVPLPTGRPKHRSTPSPNRQAPYQQNNFLYTPADFAFLKLAAPHQSETSVCSLLVYMMKVKQSLDRP